MSNRSEPRITGEVPRDRMLPTLSKAAKILMDIARSKEFSNDSPFALNALRRGLQLTMPYHYSLQQELMNYDISTEAPHPRQVKARKTVNLADALRKVLKIIRNLSNSRSRRPHESARLSLLRDVYEFLGLELAGARKEVKRLEHLIEGKHKRPRHRRHRDGVEENDGEKREDGVEEARDMTASLAPETSHHEDGAARERVSLASDHAGAVGETPQIETDIIATPRALQAEHSQITQELHNIADAADATRLRAASTTSSRLTRAPTISESSVYASTAHSVSSKHSQASSKNSASEEPLLASSTEENRSGKSALSVRTHAVGSKHSHVSSAGSKKSNLLQVADDASGQPAKDDGIGKGSQILSISAGGFDRRIAAAHARLELTSRSLDAAGEEGSEAGSKHSAKSKSASGVSRISKGRGRVSKQGELKSGHAGSEVSVAGGSASTRATLGVGSKSPSRGRQGYGGYQEKSRVKDKGKGRAVDVVTSSEEEKAVTAVLPPVNADCNLDALSTKVVSDKSQQSRKSRSSKSKQQLDIA